MKNLELTHKETEQKKKYSKKSIRLILSFVLAALLLVAILFYIFIYNSDSNKLKRYLINNNYTCNSSICSKDINGVTYNINYKNGDLNIDSPIYSFNLSNTNHKLELKKEKEHCLYEKNNFSKYDEVDETFTYSSRCKAYIEDVNEIISNYNIILGESKVDVNNFEN